VIPTAHYLIPRDGRYLNDEVLVYADRFSTVSCLLEYTSEVSGETAAHMVISGYLVDLP
jgi:hypothetical protein